MNIFSLEWWRSLGGKQEEKRPRRRNLRESNYNIDFNLGGYTDLLNRFTDGGVYAYPITNPKDRLYGSNYPFWYSEQQLNLIRAQARLLTTTNPNAQGLLNGLCSYVIGSGFGYRVMAKEGRDVDDDTIQRATDILRQFFASGMAMARDDVVVHHTDGLGERVDDDGTAESETALLKFFR